MYFMFCSRKYPFPNYMYLRFFVLFLPGNLVKTLNFPYKLFGFDTATPTEFPLTFLGVGVDIFWI